MQHVPVISTLAMNFALFDNYFAAIPGPTFPNRAFAMSATSHGFGSNDVGETFAGWPEMTMFDKLNGTGNDYRVYFTDAATVRVISIIASCAAWTCFDILRRSVLAETSRRLLTEFLNADVAL